MNKLILLLILSIIIGVCVSFNPSKDTLFFEDFQDLGKSSSKWIKSSNQEYSGVIGFKAANDPIDENDNGLVLTQAGKRYAITYQLSHAIDNTNKELIVQYELQFQEGVTCSGGYIKLYTDREDFNVETVDSNTPYSIMFGADVCGSNDRIHFIVRHRNPITNVHEEKLITAKPSVRKDRVSHIYTLIIRPDNTFTIKVDDESVLDGSFHDSFTPAFNPPKEIDDPTDSKPSDWVDDAEIPEPGATKPDDWDEDQPLRINDPQAVKPSDWLDNEPFLISDPSETQPPEWNEEDDGEWEAPSIENPKCASGQCGEWVIPTIANPLYKGKWSAPMVANPLYKGEWKPRQIANPSYFNVENPYIVEPIIAVGIEVLSNTRDILFDNFIITHSQEEAQQLLQENWKEKHTIQKERQAAKNAEDAKKLDPSQGDIFETIKFYLTLFQSEANQNPLLYLVGFSSLLLPIVFCFTRSKKPSSKKVKSDDDNNSTSTTTTNTSVTKESVSIQDKPTIESEESDESDEDNETTKKSTVTKRTNKVK
ncbi:hypothetical protein DDB_G0271144 [Dictyostelium discoideum AX4]|uniref:Calnexin n=1 Tax=Dictyostelium discoideum TaxID=44689 RepID=Q55BA8_DICDI|nr:hypothetical protein DDB_G0271144 [Dictyostelium discoideum AX4]EAL71702.1 hypothetical protein DDB_G0271144 [Dictyostelium discoideum AX4]|eukprot:XP_645704.1 hypothetical protein DDB_G0271144 [Dictyostelium discoideum AX4]